VLCLNAGEGLAELIHVLAIASTRWCLDDDLAFLLGGVNELVPLGLEVLGWGGGGAAGSLLATPGAAVVGAVAGLAGAAVG